VNCTGPVDRGGFCANCGRPVRILNGKLEHKRGRPPITVAAWKAGAPTTSGGHVPRCSDCNAATQRVRRLGYGELWWCPWATRDRHVVEDLELVACAWPYKNAERRAA